MVDPFECIGVLFGEIAGYPWLIEPPGKPGIALYVSTKSTKKDTYVWVVHVAEGKPSGNNQFRGDGSWWTFVGSYGIPHRGHEFFAVAMRTRSNAVL